MLREEVSYGSITGSGGLSGALGNDRGRQRGRGRWGAGSGLVFTMVAIGGSRPSEQGRL